MTHLSPNDSGLRTNGRLSRHVWLAVLCGLWLALLSPKVILGVPGGSGKDSGHQLQASAATAAKSAIPGADASIQIASGNADPGTLKISPAQTEVAVGRKLSFRLFDQQGRPVHDATWMVSDFTVAEIDSVDPARIAAVGPGEVTVTAIVGDQTVQAKVSVVKSPQLAGIPTQGNAPSGKGR